MTEVNLDVQDSDNKLEYHESSDFEGEHTRTDHFVREPIWGFCGGITRGILRPRTAADKS